MQNLHVLILTSVNPRHAGALGSAAPSSLNMTRDRPERLRTRASVLLAAILLGAACSSDSNARVTEASTPAAASAQSPDQEVSDTACNSNGELGDEVFPQRPGFPADANDPEPIASTGSNEWDLITTDDPSAFERLEYLGQGPEEFLPSSKDGEYEPVADAYLYRAFFTDGTTIDIRIHPEIGSKAAADAELDRYLVPLGQLPAVLRHKICRFAVRAGDETATASEGEGIMVQSGNAAIRIASRRLEETLFHEAVHTSLDPTYAYQSSQEWLDAQAADGRWLTEYGRENPDGEDLAESALYAFALLHHPERFPPGAAGEIAARIPNRIRFFESLFPSGQP